MCVMSEIPAQHKSGLEGSLVATGGTSSYRDIAIYRGEMPSKQYFSATLMQERGSPTVGEPRSCPREMVDLEDGEL
jgi:hypothetical protein